ncbi:VOC family protein [Lysobacter niastensis]|uniref:VOC family protein n=1 Tax=Lysobacter niastensis TaxID=380629 RepID=A0ABS0B461_9GAMM|nr:VOC family protein [Lysobacter niastensis]MBF6023338.1 VOC family protein [Lysobacter niastensis]
MPKASLFSLLLAVTGTASGCVSTPAPQTPLRFDHAWLVVTPGAPERAALERAGLQVSDAINRHDGQGTSSITFEFENGYLELIWPDASVALAPGSERAMEKVRERMAWRSSGRSPIGVAAARTTQEALPLQGWTISPAWLRPGTAIEILTPRDDRVSPSLFVVPGYLAVSADASRAVPRHPLGVRKVTSVRVTTPPGYVPIDAMRYYTSLGLVQTQPGPEWMLELTFDGGKQGAERDLRPELPLVLRY